MKLHFFIAIILTVLFIRTGQSAELDVVINEIAWMGNSFSSNKEWVELKNPTPLDINLTGWKLEAEDGTPNINLTGNIPSGGYFLLERTDDTTISNITADQIYTGALENGGEVLILKNSDGEVIDKVSSWHAGDNSTKASMARIDSGVGGDESDNWQNSTLDTVGIDADGNSIIGTPREDNSSAVVSIGSTEPTIAIGSTEPSVVTASSGEVVINEFVYDGEEWLELFNKTNSDFDLAGWTIEDGVRKRLDLSGTLNSSSFLVFNFSSSVLNNSGDIIILKNSDGEVIDQVSYGSWDDGDKTNNASLLSQETSLIRYPDGADTNTDSSDWQTSQNTTPGSPNLAIPLPTPQTYSHELFINELLPDPQGADSDSEWIEIFNNEEEAIDLSGWQLDDDEGGSSPYSIPEKTIIDGKGYLVLSIRKTGLSLRNTGDNARLIAPDGEVIKNVEYHNAPSNQVWSRKNNNNFVWSTTHTPGKENVFTEEALVAEVKGVQNTASQTTNLETVKEYPDGSIITTTGIISAPSNLLGKGVAYLHGSGIKIYWRGHDLPATNLGDVIKVTGELDTYLAERIIKPKQLGDFQITKMQEPPQPKIVAIADINESLEGSLLTISGTVYETSGNTFYLTDGQQTIKIVVQKSTNIDKPPTPRGSYLTITGVLSETKTGYRLLPRFESDIVPGGTLPETGSELFVLLIPSILFLYYTKNKSILNLFTGPNRGKL